MNAEQYLAQAEEFSEYTSSADQTQALALIAIAKFLARLAPSNTIAELPPGPDRIVRRS